MIKNSDSKEIILLGFPGTGKTTLGHFLALRFGLTFIDMDSIIEEKYSKTIGELTKRGTEWDLFRKEELDLLESSLKRKNVVISTGGGVGVHEQYGEHHRKLLFSSKTFKKIVLEVPFETLKDRIGHNSNGERPMIKKESDLLALYNKRIPLYKSFADYTIDTESNTLEQCFLNIRRFFNL